jgi:hypothetical protein
MEISRGSVEHFVDVLPHLSYQVPGRFGQYFVSKNNALLHTMAYPAAT